MSSRAVSEISGWVPCLVRWGNALLPGVLFGVKNYAGVVPSIVLAVLCKQALILCRDVSAFIPGHSKVELFHTLTLPFIPSHTISVFWRMQRI